MRGFQLAIFALSLGSALNAAAENRHFCGDPGFRVMSPLPTLSDQEPVLLSSSEQADPSTAHDLAVQPGPYGHSELGYRFLARSLGYPGDFTNGHEGVDQWLDEQEAHHKESRGLHQVWDRWVVNASFRLSVPNGPVSKVPSTGSSQMFFRSLTETEDFRRCLALDLAKARCEAYHGQMLRKTDAVYFGRPLRSEVCVVRDHRPLRERPPNEESIQETKTSADHTQGSWTIQRSWKSNSSSGTSGGSSSAH